MCTQHALKERLEQASGGFFLIGLGTIWLLKLDFWPWILAVFALDAALKAFLVKGWRGLFSSTLWLVGFLILIQTNTIWPGILILFGLSTVADALFPDSEGDQPKAKRKRGLPPDGELPEDDDLDEDAYISPDQADADRWQSRA